MDWASSGFGGGLLDHFDTDAGRQKKGPECDLKDGSALKRKQLIAL